MVIKHVFSNVFLNGSHSLLVQAYGDLHLLEIEQMKWTELQCEGAASATNLLGRGQGIALVHMFIKELTLYIYIYIYAIYIYIYIYLLYIYIYVVYIYAIYIYIYMLYIYIYIYM